MSAWNRPDPKEHAEYYARYIAQVPEGSILETLRDQLPGTLDLLEVPADREVYRYEEGKWSLREVVGHLIDTERMFAFRGLVMARSDGADLPSMDQDEWAARSNAHDRPMSDLTKEWIAVRRSVVHLFASMEDRAATRRGRASGYDFTVRSFPWIIAGHELWHRQLIERLYL
ncbi:MAG: DinB family protein [Gemmatimonadetes bacterium]|nr:DinB family protein [Gemmatimonadota bacterium]NNL30664.1 DinB family protein [Gemmatimonadota bacterium]